MPLDLAIVQRLDKATAGAANIVGTGNTSYIWNSYENDLQIDQLNSPITIQGTTKLAQSMMKILLTPKGSIAADPDYGTSIPSSIGGKFDSSRYADVQSEVVSALIHLNQINADNPDSDEVIETIDTVRTVASLDDPRQMMIQVAVTTESGKPVAVQVPQLI